MHVYLAAPYAARDRVRQFAAGLVVSVGGFECTSTWLVEPYEINAGTVGAASSLTDDEAGACALTDLVDIDRSDALVVFTAGFLNVDGGSGGRHVETGYALQRGLPVLVIGEPENIFHRLPFVTCVNDWIDAISVLQRMAGVE